jgi:NAD(P)-dependent dehydrogenase (short-subunit alcohol dehydrogenase family)
MNITSSQILVTGASRGIGLALTELALERGAARVYAAVRDPRALDALAARHGARLVPLALDLTRPDLIASAAARVASLDLLVNNAGLLSSQGLLSGDLGAIERDMQTNYFGTLAVTRAFLPALERAKGSVVNVLTVVALASMAGLGGYSASKAAALSLTQSLRGELGRKGMRVHAVFPGPVDTDMAREITLPKTAPSAVARAILEGVERGDEDIFPDPMARQVGDAWAKSPKDVERMFAAM